MKAEIKFSAKTLSINENAEFTQEYVAEVFFRNIPTPTPTPEVDIVSQEELLLLENVVNGNAGGNIAGSELLLDAKGYSGTIVGDELVVSCPSIVDEATINENGELILKTE